MHEWLSNAVASVRKTSRGGALLDRGAVPEAPEEVETLEEGAGRGLLLRGVTLIEYVLLISVISLVICVAGPPVADAIQGQFGKVEEVISNGASGGSGGGSDFPGGGSGNEQGGGDENPDKPGGGTDPDKPGGGDGGNNGGDTPTDPKPEKKELEGTLDLSALYVGKPGSVTARGVSAGATLVYAWSADGSGIDGATGDSWTPGAEHAGKGVVVSATDGSGTYSGSISSQSVTVKQLDMTGSVALSPAVAGRVVTAAVDGAPMDAVPGYEWVVDGQVVSTESTWTPGVEHVGKTVTVTVTDITGVYAGSISAEAVVEQAELTGSIAVAPGEAGVESAAAVDGAPSDAVVELTWKVDGAVIGTGAVVTLPEDSEGKTLVVEGRDKSGIYGGVISATLIIKPHIKVPVAFAVYSATDQSLDFYKRKSVPEVGEVFEGKTVTEVYTGIETERYEFVMDFGPTAPWKKQYVKTVEVVDDGISPISTAGWFAFKNRTLSSYVRSIDVSKLDTSRVMDMTCMFAGCTGITSIDVSNFDTSNVIVMESLFANCSNLSVLDLSSFNTSSVLYMTGLFENCSSLTEVDLSHFKTSNVESMQGIFMGCASLRAIDISGFDMTDYDANVVWGMFDKLPALERVTVGDKVKWIDGYNDLPANGSGYWYNTKGEKFKPNALPSAAADTYTLSDERPMLTGTVKADGQPVIGETLTASVSGQPSDAVLGYQWGADGVDIEGADSAIYTIAAGDAGKTVTVSVYDTSGKYQGEITSAGVTVVKPHLSGSVSIDRAIVGMSSTANVSGIPSDAKLIYKWAIDGTEKGTGSSYTPGTADNKKTLKVIVSDSSGKYEGEVESSGITVKQTALSGSVKIIDAELGKTATATVSGAQSNASLVYKWTVGGTATSDSGRTHVVTSDDIGKTIKVVVTDESGKYTGSISATAEVNIAANTLVKTTQRYSFQLEIERGGREDSVIYDSIYTAPKSGRYKLVGITDQRDKSSFYSSKLFVMASYLVTVNGNQFAESRDYAKNSLYFDLTGIEESIYLDKGENISAKITLSAPGITQAISSRIEDGIPCTNFSFKIYYLGA